MVILMTTFLIIGILSFLAGGASVEVIHSAADKGAPVAPVIIEQKPIESGEALTRADALTDVCSASFISENGELTCTLRTCLAASPDARISPICAEAVNAATSIATFKACVALGDGDPSDCIDWVGRRK